MPIRHRDVFRLNFSHGTHADHKQRLDNIRALERMGIALASQRAIPVLLDTMVRSLAAPAFALSMMRDAYR